MIKIKNLDIRLMNWCKSKKQNAAQTAPADSEFQMDQAPPSKGQPTSGERGEHKKKEDEVAPEPDSADEYSSLCVFGPESPVRRKLKFIVKHPRFDQLLIVLIVFSSVLLALENPLYDPNSTIQLILDEVNFVISIVFLIEAVIKIIAFGFIYNGKDSYLRDGWNVIDFTIAIASIPAAIYKVVRLIKVLRPLRMVSRSKGLQISIRALIRSLPNILNVLLISCIFFFIFGILCISQLKGNFYDCKARVLGGIGDDPWLAEQDIAINDKYDCINFGGQWIQSDNNFDNIFEAIMTLFQMTMVGWVVQMQQGMWSRGAGLTKDPEQKSSAIAFFFILYIIVCSFFILNLLMGVVISSFNREKDDLSNNAMLTASQKKWLETKKMIVETKLKFYMKRPQHFLRKKVYNLVHNQRFDFFILVCIIANTMVLCLTWYGEPPELVRVTEMTNYCFTFIFTMEVTLKATAYGRMFWYEGWNQLDFAIVVGSLIGIALQKGLSIEIGSSTLVIRAFRVGRLLKLFRYLEQLNLIFMTLTMTFPVMTNVGSLLFLFFYIYSVLGMFLFAQIRPNYPMNNNLNFQSIGNSMLTMIRAFTGENWQEVMHAVSRGRHPFYQCVEEHSYQDFLDNGKVPNGCGNRPIAICFFTTFVMLVSLVFINLFVAIILEGFDETIVENKQVFNLQSHEKIRNAWSPYDPFASGFIRIKDFPRFMFRLGPPVGWSVDLVGRHDTAKQQQLILDLDLATYGNHQKLQFNNVLEALMLDSLVQQELEILMCESGSGYDRRRDSAAVIRQQLTRTFRAAEDQSEALLVQEFQEKVQEMLEKNMVSLVNQYQKDEGDGSMW